MLGEVFYWLFNMSLIGSVMGVLAWGLGRIRALPRRVAVFLWVVPLVRLCVPVGLNSPYSLMTLISRLTTRTVTVYRPADVVAFSLTNTIMAADSYFPITYKVNVLESVFAVVAGVWLTVALAILLTLIVLYRTTLRELKDAERLEGNVFVSEKVDSPAVYGIVRPRIVLPAALAEEERCYVLAHERAHIRRGDNLWRLLGFLVAAVHWFNPLSWVLLKAFLADLELACDESVVAHYGEEERRAYARVLLKGTGSRNVFASAFGGAKVRMRIERVFSYRGMTWVSAIGFALLVAAVAWVLLTNAA